jgi:hypothetical protein
MYPAITPYLKGIYLMLDLWRPWRATRVVRPNLSLPPFEALEGADVTYACLTNAERNLISDNIFANILKHRHPRESENFEVPVQTVKIKGDFENWK